MAMDDVGVSPGFNDWAMYGALSGEEGQRFLGFPLLAMLAQRGEYRLISETIATEATRNWIAFESRDGSDKGDEIKEIEAELDRMGLKDAIRRVCEHDCYFGRAHMFMEFGEVEGPELTKDIGDGHSDLSARKVGKGDLGSLIVVEPVWCYPQGYNTSNPLAPDFYKPSQWFVYGKPVHKSRFLTFVSREVPDLLKAAYAFAGLSMTQMCRPYVDNWLDTRQGVTAIVKAFSTFVLSTDMTSIMAGGAGDSFLNRIASFNAIRTNSGVLAIDKEGEDFKNVSAPISGLEGIQAQALEHIASIAQMPLIKFTGISPSGLNATGDQEMRCWEDRILAYQEAFLRPHLTTIVRFVQLSLFGKVDDAIVFKFVPLMELTDQEEAELRRTQAETGEVLIRSKAVSYKEERARVATDLGGPYHGLDVEAAIEYPMTENEKAVYASTVATTTATLVSESIIDIPTAMREIKAAAEISGFGLEISDDDITEAKNSPPAPGEGEADANGLSASAPAGGSAGLKPPGVTRGLKAEA
jgi:phage-related protein (TIGR01555 family)